MAHEENLRSISRDADASLGIYTGPPGRPGSAVPNTGMQYRFVKYTGKHQVGLCDDPTDDVFGILQNKPQEPGEAATIGYEGTSFVMSGGVFSAGDRLAPDATGRAVADAVNGRWVADAPSTGAGQLVPAHRSPAA